MTASLADEIAADLIVYSEERTAELLALSQNTLISLRRKGTGPRVTVLSTGRLGYQARHIRQWLDAQTQPRKDAMPDTREAAQRMIFDFIDALAAEDFPAAEALIPASNVVGREAAALVIRALRVGGPGAEARYHQLRKAVLGQDD